MISSNCRIGIVGAGTSGVYLAKLLIQQGFQVAVFEKAPHPRTEGCGIFLVQAGMKALDRGNPEICKRIIHSGVPVRLFEFRNLRGGVISSEPVGYAENELPGILVHRKAILEALLDTLPPDCVHGNAELKSVTQTDSGVMAHFKDGRQWEGDLLVGADGILSNVRQSVVPGVQLSYLGDLVWRGVVPDQTFCPDGAFIVYARGRGVYANFFDIGGDRTHWGFFIEKDQDTFERGALRPHDPSIPRKELAKLPAAARAIIESTPPEQIVSRYSYDIDPLPHLYHGRVVLIGDAAHAKSPTRARGMTAGFEDALSLAQYLTSSANVDAALAAFEAERLPIVHEYQRTSREMSMKIGRVRKRAA
ncbi:MAG: NAD(P)-binding protein [Leptolyngbyaceae cyanobacterium RU_5_1]|nr:NAD(P)-binding protein [Leptolyngbyaceae cyanobacterium RU_5_1]